MLSLLWDALLEIRPKLLILTLLLNKMSEIRLKLPWIQDLLTLKFPARGSGKCTWLMDRKGTKLQLTIFPLESRKERSSDYLVLMELEKLPLSRCLLDRSHQLLDKVISKGWKSAITLTKSEKTWGTVPNSMPSLKTWLSTNSLNFSMTSNLCQVKIKKQLSTRRSMNLT